VVWWLLRNVKRDCDLAWGCPAMRRLLVVASRTGR
jgi:hypothetical protein